VLPDDRYIEEIQTELKLKISNAADDADITQLKARDTLHRQMQEINSLCTDNRPLRANTVLCHSTQYSLLVSHVSAALQYLRADHRNILTFICKSCKYFRPQFHIRGQHPNADLRQLTNYAVRYRYRYALAAGKMRMLMRMHIRILPVYKRASVSLPACCSLFVFAAQ